MGTDTGIPSHSLGARASRSDSLLVLTKSGGFMGIDQVTERSRSSQTSLLMIALREARHLNAEVACDEARVRDVAAWPLLGLCANQIPSNHLNRSLGRRRPFSGGAGAAQQGEPLREARM